MSRNLPPHPNLEHLKKQAKDLLHDLKRRNPASKLADAQHALAREYGFASWPKLKSVCGITATPNASRFPARSDASEGESLRWQMDSQPVEVEAASR